MGGGDTWAHAPHWLPPATRGPTQGSTHPFSRLLQLPHQNSLSPVQGIRLTQPGHLRPWSWTHSKPRSFPTCSSTLPQVSLASGLGHLRSSVASPLSPSFITIHLSSLSGGLSLASSLLTKDVYLSGQQPHSQSSGAISTPKRPGTFLCMPKVSTT